MNSKSTDNRRLTFLLAYGDEARVDVMVSPDKTYYRIDFPDTLEDGELPGLHERYNDFKAKLMASFDGELCDISPTRFKLFVNNTAMTTMPVNAQSLQRFVDCLAAEYDEMAVLYQLIKQ